LFNFGDDIMMKYINNYSTLKPENIIKLKRLCIMDWAFTKLKPTVRRYFLLHHGYATYYSIVQ